MSPGSRLASVSGIESVHLHKKNQAAPIEHSKQPDLDFGFWSLNGQLNGWSIYSTWIIYEFIYVLIIDILNFCGAAVKSINEGIC